MYNIQEIKLQNQQDAWSLLYLCLSDEMCRSFGLDGERMIRKAVKAMGQWQGSRLKEDHLAQGIPTNLTGLFQYGCGAVYDPRVRGNVQTENEQVRLWEIYICPMADFWKKRDAAALGSFFCEEYMRALVSAYTEGKGQMNVGKTLTCKRDLHCQFAAYLRPANQTSQQREKSFGKNKSGEFSNYEKQPFSDYIKEKTILLCAFLYDSARTDFGENGEAAFARGLRSFTEELIPILKKHADDVLLACDKEFLLLNFPLALDTSDDKLWSAVAAEGVCRIVQSNLLDRLKKKFQIEC